MTKQRIWQGALIAQLTLLMTMAGPLAVHAANNGTDATVINKADSGEHYEKTTHIIYQFRSDDGKVHQDKKVIIRWQKGKDGHLHVIKDDQVATIQWDNIGDYHPATYVTMPPALDPDVPEVVYHLRYLPEGDYTGLVDQAVVHVKDEQGHIIQTHCFYGSPDDKTLKLKVPLADDWSLADDQSATVTFKRDKFRNFLPQTILVKHQDKTTTPPATDPSKDNPGKDTGKHEDTGKHTDDSQHDEAGDKGSTSKGEQTQGEHDQDKPVDPGKQEPSKPVDPDKKEPTKPIDSDKQEPTKPADPSSEEGGSKSGQDQPKKDDQKGDDPGESPKEPDQSADQNPPEKDDPTTTDDGQKKDPEVPQDDQQTHGQDQSKTHQPSGQESDEKESSDAGSTDEKSPDKGSHADKGQHEHGDGLKPQEPTKDPDKHKDSHSDTETTPKGQHSQGKDKPSQPSTSHQKGDGSKKDDQQRPHHDGDVSNVKDEEGEHSGNPAGMDKDSSFTEEESTKMPLSDLSKGTKQSKKAADPFLDNEIGRLSQPVESQKKGHNDHLPQTGHQGNLLLTVAGFLMGLAAVLLTRLHKHE